jgi:hypothetical protein
MKNVYTCATAVVILVPPLAPNTIAGRIFESVSRKHALFQPNNKFIPVKSDRKGMGG